MISGRLRNEECGPDAGLEFALVFVFFDSNQRTMYWVMFNEAVEMDPRALRPKLGPSRRRCELVHLRSLHALGTSRSPVELSFVSYEAGGSRATTHGGFRTPSSHPQSRDLCCRRRFGHWVVAHETPPKYN